MGSAAASNASYESGAPAAEDVSCRVAPAPALLTGGGESDTAAATATNEEIALSGGMALADEAESPVPLDVADVSQNAYVENTFGDTDGSDSFEDDDTSWSHGSSARDMRPGNGGSPPPSSPSSSSSSSAAASTPRAGPSHLSQPAARRTAPGPGLRTVGNFGDGYHSSLAEDVRNILSVLMEEVLDTFPRQVSRDFGEPLSQADLDTWAGDVDEDARDEFDRDLLISLRTVEFIREMRKRILLHPSDVPTDDLMDGLIKVCLRQIFDQAYDRRLDDEEFEELATRVCEVFITTTWDTEAQLQPMPYQVHTRESRIVDNSRVKAIWSPEYRQTKAGGQASAISGQTAAEQLLADACQGAPWEDLATYDIDFLATTVDATALLVALRTKTSSVRTVFDLRIGDRHPNKTRCSELVGNNDQYLGILSILGDIRFHMYCDPSAWLGTPLRRWLDLRQSDANATELLASFMANPRETLVKCVQSGGIVGMSGSDPEDLAGPTVGEDFTLQSGNPAARDRRWKTLSSMLHVVHDSNGNMVRVNGAGGFKEFHLEDLVYLMTLLSCTPKIKLVHFGGKVDLDSTGLLLDTLEACRVPTAYSYVGIGGRKLESQARTEDGRYLGDTLLLDLYYDPCKSRVSGTQLQRFPMGGSASMALPDGAEPGHDPPEMRYGNAVISLTKARVSNPSHPFVKAYEKAFRDRVTPYARSAKAFVYNATFYHAINHWWRSALKDHHSAKSVKRLKQAAADEREIPVRQLVANLYQAVEELEKVLDEGHSRPFFTRLEVKARIVGPLTLDSVKLCLPLVNHRNLLDTFSLCLDAKEVYPCDFASEARALLDAFSASVCSGNRSGVTVAQLSGDERRECLFVADTIMNLVGDSNTFQRDTAWKYPGGRRALFQRSHSSGRRGFTFAGLTPVVIAPDGPFVRLLGALRESIFEMFEQHRSDGEAYREALRQPTGASRRGIFEKGYTQCGSADSLWSRLTEVIEAILSDATIRGGNRSGGITFAGAGRSGGGVGMGSKIGKAFLTVEEALVHLFATLFRHEPGTKAPKRHATLEFDYKPLTSNLLTSCDSWTRYLSTPHKPLTSALVEKKHDALKRFQQAKTLVESRQELGASPPLPGDAEPEDIRELYNDEGCFVVGRVAGGLLLSHANHKAQGADYHRSSSAARQEHLRVVANHHCFGRPIVAYRPTIDEQRVVHEPRDADEASVSEAGEEGPESWAGYDLESLLLATPVSRSIVDLCYDELATALAGFDTSVALTRVPPPTRVIRPRDNELCSQATFHLKAFASKLKIRLLAFTRKSHFASPLRYVRNSGAWSVVQRRQCALWGIDFTSIREKNVVVIIEVQPQQCYGVALARRRSSGDQHPECIDVAVVGGTPEDVDLASGYALSLLGPRGVQRHAGLATDVTFRVAHYRVSRVALASFDAPSRTVEVLLMALSTSSAEAAPEHWLQALPAPASEIVSLLEFVGRPDHRYSRATSEEMASEIVGYLEHLDRSDGPDISGECGVYEASFLVRKGSFELPFLVGASLACLCVMRDDASMRSAIGEALDRIERYIPGGILRFSGMAVAAVTGGSPVRSVVATSPRPSREECVRLLASPPSPPERARAIRDAMAQPAASADNEGATCDSPLPRKRARHTREAAVDGNRRAPGKRPTTSCTVRSPPKRAQNMSSGPAEEEKRRAYEDGAPPVFRVTLEDDNNGDDDASPDPPFTLEAAKNELPLLASHDITLPSTRRYCVGRCSYYVSTVQGTSHALSTPVHSENRAPYHLFLFVPFVVQSNRQGCAAHGLG